MQSVAEYGFRREEGKKKGVLMTGLSSTKNTGGIGQHHLSRGSGEGEEGMEAPLP